MILHSKRFTAAVAFSLVFATSQVYVGARLAEPGASVVTNPQQSSGILSTQGNNPITVNGASAIGGATIMSGATVATPAGVGATVRLGGLGWLDISPSTTFSLTFDRGRVKVVLSKGCVVLHTKKGTAGEVDFNNVVVGKTDPMKDDSVAVCAERGAVPPPNTGAGAVNTAGASASGGGMTTATKVLIGTAVAGGVVAAAIIVPCRRGRNPSPGEPRGRNDECR